MGHTYITSGEGVPRGDWPFSAAVVAGNLCFISGQPALDPESGIYRPGTVEEEFRQAFANVATSRELPGSAWTSSSPCTLRSRISRTTGP